MNISSSTYFNHSNLYKKAHEAIRFSPQIKISTKNPTKIKKKFWIAKKLTCDERKMRAAAKKEFHSKLESYSGQADWNYIFARCNSLLLVPLSPIHAGLQP